LVVYPIIKWDLEGESNVKHITSILEQWVISSLAILDVEARIDERMQGVWVQGAKIGSVGLAFRKWVSRHGFTINFATPKGRVETLDGCGLSAGTTTSLDRLGFELSADEITEVLLLSMQDSINRLNAKS
jgi:lipoyl(octanoyl) transferase